MDCRVFLKQDKTVFPYPYYLKKIFKIWIKKCNFDMALKYLIFLKKAENSFYESQIISFWSFEWKIELF